MDLFLVMLVCSLICLVPTHTCVCCHMANNNSYFRSLNIFWLVHEITTSVGQLVVAGVTGEILTDTDFSNI